MIEVLTLPVGPLQANAHLAWNPSTREAVLVDPGGDAPELLAAIEERGLRLVAIWNTHAHVDHIGANADVQAATAAPIHIHEAEEPWLRDPMLNLSAWVGVEVPPTTAAVQWKDNDAFDALGARWTIAHTPGHSPGGVCIVCEEQRVGFGGDLLMEGSMGRVDLPGSDPAAMAASLRRALAWDDRLVLHSGHGPAVTIGRERARNLVVREFLSDFPAPQEFPAPEGRPHA